MTDPNPAAGTALVIDDSDLVRELVCDALALGGWTCIQAADGVAGLQAVHDQSPDVVFCDLHMPVLDGIGVLRRLSEQGSTIPVVILSLDKDASAVEAAMKDGAYAYVVKTGDEDAIRAAAISAVEHGKPTS